jgi:hypothetical protein
MKPIKISSRITLVEADGQARVETKADLHPAEVLSAVEDLDSEQPETSAAR